MRNVETKVTEDRTLVITIDLKAIGKISASGKSSVIASTEGNVYLADADITLGLNCYRKAPR